MISWKWWIFFLKRYILCVKTLFSPTFISFLSFCQSNKDSPPQKFNRHKLDVLLFLLVFLIFQFFSYFKIQGKKNSFKKRCNPWFQNKRLPQIMMKYSSNILRIEHFSEFFIFVDSFSTMLDVWRFNHKIIWNNLEYSISQYGIFKFD